MSQDTSATAMSAPQTFWDNNPEVLIVFKARFPHMMAPKHATAGAAAYDMAAYIDHNDPQVRGNERFSKTGHWPAEITIPPNGGRHLFDTGFDIAVRPGYKVNVLPRSGLPNKHGVIIANGPGTVDEDYRGALKIGLINTDPQKPYTVSHLDAIAQIDVARVIEGTVTLITLDDRRSLVDVVGDTDRGRGGFGSTGNSRG